MGQVSCPHCLAHAVSGVHPRFFSPLNRCIPLHHFNVTLVGSLLVWLSMLRLTTLHEEAPKGIWWAGMHQVSVCRYCLQLVGLSRLS